jgi:hypothetical protein
VSAETPTPRTDAVSHEDFLGDETVSSYFARTLERELAEATARAEKLAGDYGYRGHELVALHQDMMTQKARAESAEADVARLTAICKHAEGHADNQGNRITELEAELASKDEALKPFARWANSFSDTFPDSFDTKSPCTVGDVRRAFAAIAKPAASQHGTCKGCTWCAPAGDFCFNTRRPKSATTPENTCEHFKPAAKEVQP